MGNTAASPKVFVMGDKHFRKFEYESDFDKNGIIYFIGCNYGKGNWINPAKRGKIELQSSTLFWNSKSIQHFIGRKAVHCFLDNKINSWFSINFKETEMKPTHYTLRHYSTLNRYCLRNWEFEASKDGKKWTIIRKHENDTSLQKAGASFTWKLDCNEFFSYFRIRMTAKNSSGNWYLCCSGLEIYGYLQYFEKLDHYQIQQEMFKEKYNTSNYITFNSINTRILYDNVEEMRGDVNDNEDNILYNKHRHIINEWQGQWAELQNRALCDDDSLIIPNNIDDDDEKRLYDNNYFAHALLTKYVASKSIIDEQLRRLRQATTKDHMLQLIDRKKLLSKSTRAKEFRLLSGKDNYENDNKGYETLKQRRIALQKKIEEEFKECNEMIERENELFQQLQQTIVANGVVNEEIERLKSSAESCQSVLTLYNDFIQNSQQSIDKINKYFDNSWNEYESKWMQWSVHEIIIWFKYKTIKLNTNDVDWENVKNVLEVRNVTGELLPKFNDLMFKFVGIDDLNVVNHLIKEIKILMRKFVMNNGDDELALANNNSNNNNNNNNNASLDVPKEYFCPITKQIMRDPVMAFDGHCYDRDAIENYLKIHKKSPITGANAEYMVVFPNHKLKDDIQQYITKKNSASNLQEGNEGSVEGYKHTDLV